MNNTTLKKISEMLGLSISTVSRALKDHPDISDKTKMRVTELAGALDYEPNTNAINLRTSRHNLFGLIVPTISNFFYDSFIAAIEEECRKHNYSMMILQSGDDPAVEVENIRLCRQNRIGGLFMCLSSQTTNMLPFEKLQQMDVPVIFFDKVPDDEQFNKVCVADALSASLAAEVILEKKKKKVLALFGNHHLSITRKRLESFQHTLGRKARVFLKHVNNTHEAEVITTAGLAEQPDTIFCMSDEILAGTMKALMKAGLQVPDDISVIAISNGYLPKLYHPEITYVETSGYKLGKLAYSSMMASLGGGHFQQELTIESRLVRGGSI